MRARRDLEHELWKFLKREELSDARFLVACSGGADSLALALAFSRVVPPDRLRLLHVHHGGAVEHRGRAEDFVRGFAAERGLDLRTHRAEAAGSSEDSLRQARWKFFEQERLSWPNSWIVTGHHAEDLLETRLIRLIRGTGVRGLPAILPRGKKTLRPFLHVGPMRLKAYLSEENQEWTEDPSNRDPRHLRNWLRHAWLPQLEARRPGSVKALARSMELLVEALPRETTEIAIGSSLPQSAYLLASPSEKRRWLAQLLVQAGMENFSFSQVEEIRKRLDKSRKGHSFRVAGCLWTINAQQIEARREHSGGS